MPLRTPVIFYNRNNLAGLLLWAAPLIHRQGAGRALPALAIRRVSLIETPASSKSALEPEGVSISALYFLTVASSTQIGILGSHQRTSGGFNKRGGFNKGNPPDVSCTC